MNKMMAMNIFMKELARKLPAFNQSLSTINNKNVAHICQRYLSSSINNNNSNNSNSNSNDNDNDNDNSSSSSYRLFSKKHEWILLEKQNSIGKVGITNYAQEALGDVVYVQLPDIDSQFNQDDEVGAIESVKAANEIYTPVSGTIVAVNKAIEEKPTLINSSCYNDGWLFKIQMKNMEELKDLMNEKAYEEFLKQTAH